MPPRNAAITSRRSAWRSASRARVQQRDAARQVIEYQQRLRRHVMQHRRFGPARMAHRQPLEETHDVVGREADEAAGQRHAGQFRLRTRRQRERLAQALQQLILRFAGTGYVSLPIVSARESSRTSSPSPKPMKE